MGELVIEARGLRRSYGEVEAVRGVDVELRAGEVLAFLGPNGAGKTTTVEILEGYRSRDGGEVSVLGSDPARPTRRWRERIGLVLQANRLQPRLTVAETLEQYAGYYREPLAVDRVLGLVGLEHRAAERVGRLSGGQQRRLDVGTALIGDPELLFLDEPTTGFDPAARRRAWEVIAGLRELGKTVFLTTHYMEEAQALADRVAIIVAGRIVATGPPDAVGGRDRALTRVSFSVPDPSLLPGELRDGAAAAGERTTLTTDDPTALLHRLTAWALNRGVELGRLEVSRPSLEDVYLRLTVDEGSAEETER